METYVGCIRTWGVYIRRVYIYIRGLYIYIRGLYIYIRICFSIVLGVGFFYLEFFFGFGILR